MLNLWAMSWQSATVCLSAFHVVLSIGAHLDESGNRIFWSLAGTDSAQYFHACLRGFRHRIRLSNFDRALLWLIPLTAAALGTLCGIQVTLDPTMSARIAFPALNPRCTHESIVLKMALHCTHSFGGLGIVLTIWIAPPSGPVCSA
jgi:hypothetical protein